MLLAQLRYVAGSGKSYRLLCNYGIFVGGASVTLTYIDIYKS